MQNSTAAHPTELESALASIGLADLLTGYVTRARVGVRYREIAAAAAQFGYGFKHRDGNVYGALKLEPINDAPVPALRLITRSDHAAVHGSRRAA